MSRTFSFLDVHILAKDNDLISPKLPPASWFYQLYCVQVSEQTFLDVNLKRTLKAPIYFHAYHNFVLKYI